MVKVTVMRKKKAEWRSSVGNSQGQSSWPHSIPQNCAVRDLWVKGCEEVPVFLGKVFWVSQYASLFASCCERDWMVEWLCFTSTRCSPSKSQLIISHFDEPPAGHCYHNKAVRKTQKAWYCLLDADLVGLMMFVWVHPKHNSQKQPCA